MKIIHSCLLFIVSIVVSAQTDIPFDFADRRLALYNTTHPVEKLYVHQDRTHYIAGETLWFKIYQSVSPAFPVPSAVVYVEITDGHNRKVADTKWKLTAGKTSGHIDLPDTLAEGTYQLRAYTLWQLKSATEEIFTRELKILSQKNDPLKIETDFSVSDNVISAVLRFPEIPEGDLNYRLRINGDLSDSYPMEPDENGEYLVDIELPDSIGLEGPQFFIVEMKEGSREFPIPLSPAVCFNLFPEGGYLVTGLPSKVAFKVTDQYGRGLDVSGVVLDNEGNEVRRFESRHLGHGSFNFQPEEGKEYTAVLHDLFIKQKFPEPKSNGIVMSAAHRGDRLRLTLRHNLTAGQDGYSPLFLIAHQEGVVRSHITVDLTEDTKVIDIPHGELPEGIFTVTIYDGNYHVYAERLCLVKYPEHLDLKITAGNESVKRRQKMTLELENLSKYDGFSGGDFSIAVIKADLYDPEEQDNLYTYSFLTSELKGRIEKPATYLNQDNNTNFQNLDLLLLTHGWRRYDWDAIMSGELPGLNTDAETGLAASGKVYMENERQKTEEVEVTGMLRHNEFMNIVSLTPDKEGVFTLTGYNFTDTAEVIISAAYKKRTLNVSMNERSRQLPGYYDYGEGLSDRDTEAITPENSEIRREASDPGIDQIIHELDEVSVTARRRRARGSQIYHQAIHDDVFNLSVYNVKKDFSYSVASSDGGRGFLGAIGLLYHVPGVSMYGDKVRVRATGAMEVKIGGKATPGEVDPVYILDGMKTTYENLKAISPALIEKVEVLNPTSAMLYDQAPWGGAIVFHTRNWDGMVYSTPTKTISYKFPGYNQKKEFFSPTYAEPREYIDPDHRNTLYWQDSFILGNRGKAVLDFYTSDDKGEYLIHCEGRSNEGKIGSVYQYFTVE